MALGPLTVSKQVSPCNQLIRVQGQITGARVDIFVNGNNVPAGGGIAHSPDQDFSINSNIILNAEIVS
ncbi:MAG: hypothetical protein WCD28_11500, partial [Nitrososphaeraceae archaeon]